MHEKLVWMHGGEVLNSSPGSVISTSGNTTSAYSVLTLEEITQERNGSYACQYGNLKSKVELLVLGKDVLNVYSYRSILHSILFTIF